MDPLRVGRVDFINTFPLAWSLGQRHDGADRLRNDLHHQAVM